MNIERKTKNGKHKNSEVNEDKDSKDLPTTKIISVPITTTTTIFDVVKLENDSNSQKQRTHQP